MNAPTFAEPREVARETTLLPAYTPVPGFGVLPVNSFVIRGEAPVLVDTGLAALRGEFMNALRATIRVDALEWIWLTHVDADHVGNLAAVLDEAPRARVVTTFLGMGKMGMLGLPLDRVHLLNPGQTLDLPDRVLTGIRPPSYDAPETTGLFDSRSRALYSSDCFGALLDRPADTAAAVGRTALRDGVRLWASVDAPWLADVAPARLDAAGAALQRLAPQVVLGSHLPPADGGLLGTLLEHVEGVGTLPPFEGPDQAALERMLHAA